MFRLRRVDSSRALLLSLTALLPGCWDHDWPPGDSWSDSGWNTGDASFGEAGGDGEGEDTNDGGADDGNTTTAGSGGGTSGTTGPWTTGNDSADTDGSGGDEVGDDTSGESTFGTSASTSAGDDGGDDTSLPCEGAGAPIEGLVSARVVLESQVNSGGSGSSDDGDDGGEVGGDDGGDVGGEAGSDVGGDEFGSVSSTTTGFDTGSETSDTSTTGATDSGGDPDEDDFVLVLSDQPTTCEAPVPEQPECTNTWVARVHIPREMLVPGTYSLIRDLNGWISLTFGDANGCGGGGGSLGTLEILSVDDAAVHGRLCRSWDVDGTFTATRCPQ